MHEYGNLCKTRYATDSFLFSVLQAIMRRLCVTFQPNPFSSFHLDLISSFSEKVTDGRMEGKL